MYRIYNVHAVLPTAPLDLFDIGATLASNTCCSSHAPTNAPHAAYPAFCGRLVDHTGNHYAPVSARTDRRVTVLAEWDDDRATDGRLELCP